MANKPHTLIVEIAPDGKVKGEVKGITGQECGPLTKWLDELGKVEVDRHTPDWYKDEKAVRTINR